MVGEVPKSEDKEGFHSHGELLQHFEEIGEKVNARWIAEHPDTAVFGKPRGLEGVFPLSSGGRARYSWIRSPLFNRPEHWLPSGFLTTRADRDGVERTESFTLGRYIHPHTNDAQPIVRYDAFEHDREVESVPLLTSSARLREMHAALEEIEKAIDVPDQPIDWRRHGTGYVW